MWRSLISARRALSTGPLGAPPSPFGPGKGGGAGAKGGLSGFQSEVLSLYRSVLRLARRKELEAPVAPTGAVTGATTRAVARDRFRTAAYSVRRSEFQRIEFMLRQGHKQLKTLEMPGARGAAGVVAKR